MQNITFFSAGIDARTLETDHVDKADAFQYRLCATCWCALVYDVTNIYAARELEHCIMANGLYACIASADGYAKMLLTALDGAAEDCSNEFLIDHTGLNHVWSTIVSYAAERSEWREASPTYSILFGDNEEVALAATCQIVLRFPKRFTVAEPDASAGFKKFRDVHRATKDFGNDWSKWPGSTIMAHMKAVMREILIPKNKVVFASILQRYAKRPGTFSNGSIYLNQVDVGFAPEKADEVFCYNQALKELKDGIKDGQFDMLAATRVGITHITKKTLGEIEKLEKRKYPKWEFFSAETCKIPAIKWGALGMDSDYLYTHANLYGYYPPVTIPRTKYSGYVHKDGHLKLGYPVYRKRDVLVSPVPKDYETSRMIAPETAYLNVEGSRVRSLFVDLLQHTGFIAMMPPEDQSLNRERAREGSIYPQENPYCTKDLSHASDSISRAFFFELLPVELHCVVREALSDYMVVETDIIPTKMLATSGSVLTPMLQSVFFLTVLITACDLANEPRDVSCYNDDLICRQSVEKTVDDLLTAVGATVNEKKSFEYGPFRESCGGEYLNGVDVTGVYWPRHAIPDLRRTAASSPNESGAKWLEGLQTLLSLQHKLYEFPTVRQILEGEILRVVPDMTYSPVGTDADDLWASWIDEYSSMKRWHYKFANKRILYSRRDIPEYLRQYYAIGSELQEYYAYTEWLRSGPVYPDKLCESLHVASIPTMHANTRAVIRLVKDEPKICSIAH